MDRNLRGRAAQRGKSLDEDCKRAKISRYEYGFKDKRKYCYGLCADHSIYELHEKCRECGAHVDNAKPPEGREDAE